MPDPIYYYLVTPLLILTLKCLFLLIMFYIKNKYMHKLKTKL